MDLLNMINRIKIHEFRRRLNRGNFYHSSHSSVFYLQDESWQQIQNFSTISQNLGKLGQKNTGTWVMNTTIHDYS